MDTPAPAAALALHYEGELLAANAAVFSADAHRRIITWNPGAERLYGFTSEEALGADLQLIVPETLLDESIAFGDRVLKGESFTAQTVRRPKSGKLLDVFLSFAPLRDEEGKIAGICCVALDISERRAAERRLQSEIESHLRTEQALWAAERDFRTFFETVGVGNVIADAATGRFLRVNERYCEITGYTAEELYGMTSFDLTDPEDVDRDRMGWQEALLQARPSFVIEKRYRRKDGSRVWVQVTSTVVLEEGTSAPRAIGVIQDISERKRAEAALEESRRELLAASHAKDQFLAVLSHELRTPLTPILLCAQSLAARPDLPRSVADMLQMISRNAQLEARLIDDLLDLTRIAHGKLQVAKVNVDLHETIRHAVEISQPDFDARKQRLAVSLDAEQSLVRGDGTRLQQVVWNLLKNASKFSPHGSEIRLRSYNNPGVICVEIADKGIGIAPQAIGGIFGAFSQADPGITRRFGGLGLGLAISKAVMDAHMGTIRASSEGEGKGSTFTIEMALLAT